MAAGLVAATAHAQSNTWKVPAHARRPSRSAGRLGQQQRDADDAAAQWKDKERAHRRRGRRAEAARRASTSIRAATRSSATSSRWCSTRRTRASSTRPRTTDHRQLQPVLDGRSRVGQPDVAHHRSARRPDSAADARGAGAGRRGRGRSSSKAPRADRAVRPMVPKIGRSPSAASPTARRAPAAELQQLRPDHPVAGHRGRCCRR